MMEPGCKSDIVIDQIEELLVRQFRRLQKLLTLTKAAREALLAADPDRLLDLTEQMSKLLHELDDVLGRQDASLEQILGAEPVQADHSIMQAMLSEIEPQRRGRLERLRRGSLILAEEIRGLNRGNCALVKSGKVHLDALADFFLQCMQPEFTYQPLTSPPPGKRAELDSPCTDR